MSQRSLPLRRAAFAACALGVSLVAGCSQADSLGLEPIAPPISAAIGATSFIPTPAELIVPSTRTNGIGSFTAAIVPDNSGRATSEFWDQYSMDMQNAGTLPRSENKCNVGFYAAGIVDSLKCQNLFVTPTTEFATGKYWGDSTDARDASAFMFKGGFTYTIRYVARMAGGESEIGYFTKTNGVYSFTPFTDSLPAGDTLAVGVTSLTLSPSQDWGIYIKNDLRTEGGGCATAGAVLTFCSDAEGGWRGIPGPPRTGYQHMALMVNSAGTKYLLGIEDTKVGTLNCPNNECGQLDPATLDDADYNDHIFLIEPAEVQTAVGRFTGGGIWTAVPTYGKVTIGFTLHCDNVLANNLQINWDKKKWHIEKNTLDPVACTRPGNPVPPRAPVNKIVATAKGKYFDGRTWIDDVYTDFILVDNGEPSAKSKNSGGTEEDRIALRVYKGGTTYLVVGSTTTPTLLDIRGGNIQAHYDQPHGSNWNRTP